MSKWIYRHCHHKGLIISIVLLDMGSLGQTQVLYYLDCNNLFEQQVEKLDKLYSYLHDELIKLFSTLPFF